MQKKNLCPDCTQSHNCGKVYQQLADTKVPSIVIKAVTAFLLPIIIFIAGLALLEDIFVQYIQTENLRLIVCCLLAAGAAFCCVLITRAVNHRLGRK